MTFENLSNAEQDILEALSKFGEHSEIEANEIIGYIETIKQNALEEYKQKVKKNLRAFVKKYDFWSPSSTVSIAYNKLEKKLGL